MGAKKTYETLTKEQQGLVIENKKIAEVVGGITYHKYMANLDKIPMTRDDFISAAYMYLCIAAKNYKESNLKGASFSTYAYSAVSKGLYVYIMRTSSLLKLPTTARDKKFFIFDGGDTLSFQTPCHTDKNGNILTLEDMLSDYNNSFEAFELMQLIDETLEEEEKYIFLSSKLNDRTQKELGKELGVSQMQISRILNKAIEKLRESLVV